MDWMAKGQPFDFAVLVLHTTVLKTPAKRSQHLNATLLGATCCVRLTTVLRHVGCCWLKFDHFQIWANNTQHVATYRNTVAKRTQHVVPNNVAICWVGMLRSFGRGVSCVLHCDKTRRAFETTREMSCSQMPIVFYHSAIHGLGSFTC